eukprot:1157566-Pelagomonas_calceolata.AAC.8
MSLATSVMASLHAQPQAPQYPLFSWYEQSVYHLLFLQRMEFHVCLLRTSILNLHNPSSATGVAPLLHCDSLPSFPLCAAALGAEHTKTGELWEPVPP